ncbi:MAG TPA: response regulator transcription factor [Verrucomicrobiae bacterium]|nr:response regulator transcription factor [Verrucomicrobiae bacterium]
MKLLIIEDNRLLASSLKSYLGKSFVVHTAHTAADGLHQAETKHFDLIILDLHLPDGNGLKVCSKLRAGGVETPILILTASKETTTKVELLDAGADDFLTKPFQAPELRARLQVLLRRGALQFSTARPVFKDLTLDLTTRSVQREDQNIKLRRKEFDILEYLMRNKGRVITRKMILDHVWESDTPASSNTVDVHMKHLRDKVDRPFKTPLIETVYGFGYIMR